MSQSLSIQLDRPHFFSGEHLTGTVTFSNTDPNLVAKYFHLRAKGVERTFIQKGENPQQQDCTNLKSTIPLADFRNFPTVPTGTFHYPFSVYLSPELPSSHHGKERNMKGSGEFACYYELKAYLEKEGDDVKEKVSFLVSQSVTHITAVRESKDRSSMPGLGKLGMTAEIEKNVFIPGEKLKVKVAVENKSSRGVDKLKVKLIKVVKIKAHGLKFGWSQEVSREKVKGVSSSSKGEKEIEFKIKDDIMPSCHGKLIRITYHLAVSCDIKLARDLEVKGKIKLLLPPCGHNPHKPEFKKVWDHKKIKKKMGDSDDEDGFEFELDFEFFGEVAGGILSALTS